MREKYVAQMRAWIGRNEYDGSHRLIIDTYSTIKEKLEKVINAL